MAFVEYKCPNCGAKLNVLNNLKKSFCSYCGCELLIENDNDDSSEINRLVELIKEQFNVKNYQEVTELAKKILVLDSGNFYGWFFSFYADMGFNEFDTELNFKHKSDFDLKYKGVQALTTLTAKEGFNKLLKVVNSIEKMQSEEQTYEVKIVFELLKKVFMVIFKGLTNSCYIEEGKESLKQNERNYIRFLTVFDEAVSKTPIYESKEYKSFMKDAVKKYKKFTKKFLYRFKMLFLKERKAVKPIIEKY